MLVHRLAFIAAIVCASCGGKSSTDDAPAIRPPTAAPPTPCTATLSGAVSGRFPCSVSATLYADREHTESDLDVTVDHEAAVPLAMHLVVSDKIEKRAYDESEPPFPFFQLTVGKEPKQYTYASGPWRVVVDSVTLGKPENALVTDYAVSGTVTAKAVYVENPEVQGEKGETVDVTITF